jgi:hypothetical protein
MKKIKNVISVFIVTNCILFGFIESADAQITTPRFEFGIRYMPTFTAMDFKTYDGGVVQASATMSNGFGVMMAFNLSSHVGLQGEINYYEANQSYVDRSINYEVKIQYLNVPLLLSLNTDKSMPVNLNFVAGPQFGFNVGSSVNSSGSEGSDTLNIVAAVKPADIGFAYGAGLEFALNSGHSIRLDVGYRGFYGLVDMNSTSTGSDSYNIIVSTSRKTNGGYLGLTFLF